MTVLTVVLACVALMAPIALALPQGVLHTSLGGASSSGPSSSASRHGHSSHGPSVGISTEDPRFTTTTTYRPPIPIIRHINRVNNDGSYTFGYESGDGSYRVETRGLNGLTQGRYGYIDEGGVRKEVDYLAGAATGYEPRGQGITVPPRLPPLQPGAVEDDGQWRPETVPPPLATRTRARDFIPQDPLGPTHHQPLPPPSPQPLPPPAPQPQQPPQSSFSQPPADFHFPSHSAPSDFSHRQINAPSPPQPIDFGHQQFSQPAPAPQPAPQPAPAPVFRQPQQPAPPARASPIEQFLRQQLNSGPQQQQPQQQPITRQLF